MPAFDFSKIPPKLLEEFGPKLLLSSDPITWADLRKIALALIPGGAGGIANLLAGKFPPTPSTPSAEQEIDEIYLSSVEPFHPSHGSLSARITDDNMIVPASGTDNWDDNTDFVLHIGYRNKGQDVSFPEGSPLDHSSVIRLSSGSKVALLSKNELKGGGLMADGPQIRKEYDRTRGMDPVIKFPPKDQGGPALGAIVTLQLEVGEAFNRYTFAPFQ